MVKQPHSVFGLSTTLLVVISPEPPLHAEGHDEWRLDEALAETFPASDSIAVTPIHPFRISPLPMPEKVERKSTLFECKISCDENSDRKALETTIECTHCHTTIPATVALNFEGSDYIYQFCGPQCLDAWCKAAIAHDK